MDDRTGSRVGLGQSGVAHRVSRRGFVRGPAAAVLAITGTRLVAHHSGAQVGAPVATAFPPPPGTSRVKLSVTPNPVAADAPFGVRLSGLAPGQTVTLHSVTADDADLPWIASATFQADTRGGVDLATQAPRAGSDAVADPTGLVWAALPPGRDWTNPSLYDAATTEYPLEYFGKALDWLKSRPCVRGDRLAVMGTSRGGELALLLGATYPQFKAVVSYVGRGIVFGSPTEYHQPARAYQGRPVPSDRQAADADAPERAEIPVERINGPVMLLAADADKIWPSTLLSQLAFNRLREHGHPYPDEFHHYPNAGHLIQPPYVPTAQGLYRFGGTQQGMAADADSWPRVLRMLEARPMG